MNKRQRSVIWNFVITAVVTAVFIVAMLSIKDLINKSEATRAMEMIGEEVTEHRKQAGSLPPKSYVDDFIQKMGFVRIGDLQYRALWIKFDAGDDTILAYSWKGYRSLVDNGYVVLRLAGSIEWMGKDEFENLLKTQQSQAELDLLQKQNNL